MHGDTEKDIEPNTVCFDRLQDLSRWKVIVRIFRVNVGPRVYVLLLDC